MTFFGQLNISPNYYYWTKNEILNTNASVYDWSKLLLFQWKCTALLYCISCH